MRAMLVWITAVATILGFALGPSIVEVLQEESGLGNVRVAMLHYGPIEDVGWTYQGHLAAQEMTRNLPWVTLEEVEDAPAQGGEDVIRQYAEAGYDLIFTHGWGSDLLPGIASDYPNAVFMCGGAHGRLAPNVGTYYGRTHEARYLAGMVAGHMTESGLIGYAPSYPLPRVIAGINAFARGVAATNTDAMVEIAWVDAWYDPVLEAEAISELIARGCDVVTHDSDSFSSAQAAEEGGIFYIASHAQDMTAFAPSVYLTALEWDWMPLFTDVVAAVRDGTWESKASEGWWYGLPEGCITLAPMSDLVPEAVRQEIEARRDEILRGEFIVFPALTDEELWQVVTFEPNVVSGLPGD
ncbi:BMP family ABC transporter substrate-binding protein [Candidatus Bipolaricaulota bacterium]